MNPLVLYLPVIHRGYIDFFSRHEGEELYVLGDSLLAEFPHLARDMRAVKPEAAVAMARSLVIFHRVNTLEKDNLPGFLRSVRRVTMPDDEVSRGVAEKYFGGINVSFENVFLRWHKTIAALGTEAHADRKTSTDLIDQEMLGAAYGESERSSDWWRHVGAVAVRGGKILFSSHNAHQPSEHTPYIVGDPRSSFDAGERIELSSAIHAEAAIVAQAAKAGISLLGADMYVTTFPCPACAYAIANAGIARVFYREGYSLIDADAILRARGIELVHVADDAPAS